MVPREKALFLPQAGRIKGGRLDGWHYHLLHFRAQPRGLHLVARCTPPAWPFPRDIELDGTHFVSLRHVVGSRAKRVDATSLIDQAYRLAGLDTPAWAVEPGHTLRWRIQRARVGRTYPRGTTQS